MCSDDKMAEGQDWSGVVENMTTAEIEAELKRRGAVIPRAPLSPEQFKDLTALGVKILSVDAGGFCPVCGRCDSTEVELASLGGVTADRCAYCGTVWILDYEAPPSYWDRTPEQETFPLDSLSRLVGEAMRQIMASADLRKDAGVEAILMYTSGLNQFRQAHQLEGVLTPAVCDLLLSAFEIVGGRLCTAANMA